MPTSMKTECVALGVNRLPSLEKLSSVHKVTMRCLLWPFALLGALCSSGPASALDIGVNGEHYHAARGSDVKLACPYTHTVSTTQYTEIMWSIVSGPEERHVIWFTDGHLYPDLDKALEGRVHFISSDPHNGDASIIIRDLRLSDSGKYRCFVKKLPELDFKSVELTVIEAPGQPQCSVDREFAGGYGVTLKCKSSHGSHPLRYTWAKTSGNQVLPANAVVDTVGGTLRVDNTGERNCGSYRCTADSMVDTKHCELVLKCPPPSQPHTDVDSPQSLSTTAVASIAVFVTISVLGLVAIAAAFYWHRQRSVDLNDKIAI